jgi:hypothetical protein
VHDIDGKLTRHVGGYRDLIGKSRDVGHRSTYMLLMYHVVVGSVGASRSVSNGAAAPDAARLHPLFQSVHSGNIRSVPSSEYSTL